ncbi:MAG: nucleotidyltransferase [Anaerolineaceae bacterium]|jgi:NDP-sugar pyrophosphorylase family protein
MVKDITLIIMAAGIGSRYGGLKQVDPVGPGGEIVIDYSIFDALRAGFSKVVFLIRPDLQEVFHAKIGQKVARRAEIEYVYQELTDLPPGFAAPAGRQKPWGTGHAVLSCRNAVHNPFAAINADDFYGRSTFEALAGYLRRARPGQPGLYECCMPGYRLGNTLSEYGSVARGVCQVTENGYLAGIQERTHIEREGERARFLEGDGKWVYLPFETPVSMNMWGFTPAFFLALQEQFPLFLEKNSENLSKAEFYLPDVVNTLIQQQRAQVKVLPTREKWFGVTYPEDRPFVQSAIRQLIGQGMYPERLWD